jgi:hypothetical protein
MFETATYTEFRLSSNWSLDYSIITWGYKARVWIRLKQILKIQDTRTPRSIELKIGTSVAQSSEQAPFTSEIVGSILATDSCMTLVWKESVNALPKVVGFLRFPPTGNIDRVGWDYSSIPDPSTVAVRRD